MTGTSPTARNVPILALTTGVNVVGMTTWIPILPLILRDLGAPDFWIGSSVAIWTVVGSLFQYQGGVWCDRLGRRALMVYPTYLGGLLLGLASFMPSWKSFVPVYVLWYAMNSLQDPAFPAIVGESVPAPARGRAFGLFKLFIAVAGAAGPLIGAVLLPSVGSRGLLLATSGAFLATAAARQFLLRETRPAAVQHGGLAWAELLQGRLGLVLLILVCQTAIVALGLYGPFLTLHARDAMSLSKSEIDVLYALAYILAACASPWAGKAVAMWGADRVLAWAALTLGASLLFWTAQTRPVLIVAWMLVSAGCFQFLVVAGDAFRATALPDSIRGRALGAIGAISRVISAAEVFLAGHWRLSAPVAPFLLLAATALVAFAGVQVLAARERPAGAVTPGT